MKRKVEGRNFLKASGRGIKMVGEGTGRRTNWGRWRFVVMLSVISIRALSWGLLGDDNRRFGLRNMVHLNSIHYRLWTC